MSEIYECIATCPQAIEIEGKTAKTVASYANSLADFRTVGRRLGLPQRPAEYPLGGGCTLIESGANTGGRSLAAEELEPREADLRAIVPEPAGTTRESAFPEDGQG